MHLHLSLQRQPAHLCPILSTDIIHGNPTKECAAFNSHCFSLGQLQRERWSKASSLISTHQLSSGNPEKASQSSTAPRRQISRCGFSLTSRRWSLRAWFDSTIQMNTSTWWWWMDQVFRIGVSDLKSWNYTCLFPARMAQDLTLLYSFFFSVLSVW